MRQIKYSLAILSAVAVLAGCSGGGSTAGDQTLKAKYSAQISFGDSLSDVGTYAVGTVAALKGGKFTINGNNVSVNAALTGKNWTELMAAQFSLPAPCAAQTGLHGDASQGFAVPVVNHTGCFGYAQGGARITGAIGPGNQSAVGALTVPVATQIQNHLAISGGKFKSDEIIFVMAGANDIFTQVGILTAGATAAGQAAGAQTFAGTLINSLAAGATNPATAAQAIGLALATENARVGHTDATVVGAAVGAAAVQPGNSAVASPAVYGPMVANAQAKATTAGQTAGANYVTATAPSIVAEMGRLGAELGDLVKNQIVAKGATHVVVNNMPDVGTTPDSLAATASQRDLVNAMVGAFNTQLSAKVSGDANIVLVDVFTVSHDQATNPGPYGLTNVTTRACDLSPAKNPLGGSLGCNASNLIAGDVSHYQFADGVHPTPFGHFLLARYVSERLVVKGWL